MRALALAMLITACGAPAPRPAPPPDVALDLAGISGRVDRLASIAITARRLHTAEVALALADTPRARRRARIDWVLIHAEMTAVLQPH